MNLKELYDLYNYLNRVVENYYMDNMTTNNEFEPYLENENMIYDLYHQILHGKATRKDFLISAIKDMIYYINTNKLDKPKSSLLFRFERIYCKQQKEL